MSNLIECNDCGHDVSKRAKVCPSCGVGNPANRTSLFTSIAAVVAVFWLVGYISVEVAKVQQGPSSRSSTLETRNTITARTYTDVEIWEAIAQSDDYNVHRAAFTKAASYLLTTNRCTHRELTEYGGFWKAQGEDKYEPIYFTYCGGNHIENRLYVDASTGKVYK